MTLTRDVLHALATTRMPPDGFEALTVLTENYLEKLTDRQRDDLRTRDASGEMVLVMTTEGSVRLSQMAGLN